MENTLRNTRENIMPRKDAWTAPQHGTAFALGLATPYSELDALVQGISEAFDAHGALIAHGFRFALRAGFGKQSLGFENPTDSPFTPINNAHFTHQTLRKFSEVLLTRSADLKINLPSD
ncbi:hypothetical protein J2X68_008050 [Streptomyces sp. 3330]|nr:hypothetical protein [Streptomyces sp. 3330]